MTNHAISIDGLIQASDALRNFVRREDVLARRAVALREIRGRSGHGVDVGERSNDLDDQVI